MNKMFSEINSVRSDPLGHLNSRLSYQTRQNIFFDSQDGSQSRYQTTGQRWKNMLLPQIDIKYQQIMRQREGTPKRIEIQNQKSRVSVISRNSKLNPRLSNSGLMDMKTMQNVYQQKIQALQEQNQNLRQQLFYLREALLINFETKQKMKEKQQKTPTKKPQ